MLLLTVSPPLRSGHRSRPHRGSQSALTPHGPQHPNSVRSLPTLACLKRVGSQPSSPACLEVTHHRLPAASGQPPGSIQGKSLARSSRPALSELQHGTVRPPPARDGADGALERAIERVLDHRRPQTNHQTLNPLWPSSQDQPASALARQLHKCPRRAGAR